MWIEVDLLPGPTLEWQVAGSCAVVVDVLRATTTVIAALDAGAAAVIPCVDVATARRIARESPSKPLLGGERGGLPPAGFDLGNSPREYLADRVRGREIVMTTTNGTRAMDACRAADRLVLAAFTNLAAAAESLVPLPRVHIVCAGTDGQATEEDTWLAGALLSELRRRGADLKLNDVARWCESAWHEVQDEDLLVVLRQSRGGRNLIQVGLDDDLQFAAQRDRSHIVPEMDVPRWRISR